MGLSEANNGGRRMNKNSIHFSPFPFPPHCFFLFLTLKDLGYFGDVVYQTPAEHGVQLDLVILQDVLQGTSRAVLCEEAAMRSCNAGANEAHQMIVGHIFHLNGKWKKKKKKSDGEQ